MTAHKPLFFAALLALAASAVEAATFVFGSNANGLNGLTQKTLSAEGLDLTLAAGPAGVVFNELGRAGLGADSRPLAGVTGDEIDKFTALKGPGFGPADNEFATLTFSTPGLLTAIDFDGVKDEPLEHFVLTTGSGARYFFFDSAANTTVPGAVDAAVDAGAVDGEIVYLLEGGGFDDEIAGLAIPFAAGETLTLSYGEFFPRFGALFAGNGARLSGLTVATVPEPGSLALVLIGAVGAARRR